MVDTKRVKTVDYAETLARADVVLQAVSDGVTVQDRTGAIVYANQAAARMHGFPDAATMLATPSAEISARFELRDEDGAVIETARLPGRRVLAGEAEPPPLLVHIRDRASGRSYWSKIYAKAVRDATGEIHLAVNVWHEVTAAQRTKEAGRFLADVSSRLGASLDYEETLASVANVLVPGLADWVVVDLVDRGRQRRIATAHIDPKKLELAREFGEKYPPPEDAPAGVANVMRTGKPELYSDITEEMIRASARDAYHLKVLVDLQLRSAMIVPILVDGKVEGTITLIGAESGRRYDAEDLVLAEEIARRSASAITNARAFRAAQDAAKLREEFIAVAGHELRTPLAALQLLLDSVRASADAGLLARDPAKFLARIDKAFTNLRKLTRLIDGLLDVSRLSSGRLVLERTPMDLAELVRAIAERFAEPAEQAHAPLQVDAKGPVKGVWDASRLDQVVSNLVSNAIKYGAGSPVRIACSASADEATITVADAGIGVPKEDRERIFGRFERAVS